ncbi:MAG: glycine cleavage system aminomethyltransferase GcvT [Saccharofermentanales bacterium]
MKKTPLNDRHVALGARMVDYAGWDMPVKYEGIPSEVMAVRENVGVFDVSHMGEIRVKGAGAGAFLDWLLSRPVSHKKADQITYVIMAQADGGTVDDLLVYPLGEEDYLLVVNAANKDKDFAHIRDSLKVYGETYPDREHAVEILDESDLYGQIAVQGPKSLDALVAMADRIGLTPEHVEQLKGLKRFREMFVPIEGEDRPLILSRTGYTGENGYELYMPAAKTGMYWDACMDAGVVPCGLGARDTLRLEAGMPLYGHEMSEEINALDANMGFFVDLDRPFQGRAMQDNVTRRQIAIVSDTRAIPREGYDVLLDGKKVGVISSGTFSPTLEKGIAFAFVDPDTPEVEKVDVQVRKRVQPFTVVKAPFID